MTTMKYRTLGKTGLKISEVSLGTWQLGGKWGDPFSTQDAQDTLAAAYDAGVNFFDTADVYQDGQSEHAIGQFRKTHDDIIISTKIGRKLPEQTAAGYSPDNIRQWIDDCLTNQGVDALDNVLLHCPSFDTYYTPETFFTLDQLQKEGKIKNYGVSVEKVEQAIKALDYNIGSVEIIFNMFRLRPAKLFFELAKQHNVGILARVPLASGLLSGKYTLDTQFGPNDQQTTNRHGEQFDKGETFSGVDYATGVKAANELKTRLHTDNLAATALRWILMFDAVSTVIPGASKASQISRNTTAADLPALTHEQMGIVEDVYAQYIKNPVDYLW
jgi:aryl-alcohol dehydrogenase-like predicted oxidoreductase